MISYDEAVKASLDLIESKHDEEEMANATIASADMLASRLVKTFFDLMMEGSKNGYRYVSFAFIPTAFELARVACEDFFETKGPEGFADDLKNLIYENTQKWSEEAGLLKKWYEANRKSGEEDGNNARETSCTG